MKMTTLHALAGAEGLATLELEGWRTWSLMPVSGRASHSPRLSQRDPRDPDTTRYNTDQTLKGEARLSQLETTTPSQAPVGPSAPTALYLQEESARPLVQQPQHCIPSGV